MDQMEKQLVQNKWGEQIILKMKQMFEFLGIQNQKYIDSLEYAHSLLKNESKDL